MIKIQTEKCEYKQNDDIYKFYLLDKESKIKIKNISESNGKIELQIKTNIEIMLKHDDKIILIDNEEKIIKIKDKLTIKIKNSLIGDKGKIIFKILTKETKSLKINNNFNDYPILFHKYNLKISNPNESIEYLKINKNIKEEKKYYLHIHCYDLDNFKEYFNRFINEYRNLFNLIITYSKGDIEQIFKMNYEYVEMNAIWLKIKNKGADIGGKICAINYLNINNTSYEYILFIHSKSDQTDRENYLKPFIGRAELIINLLTDPNKKIDAIFPNYHNILYNKNNNYHCIKHNQEYLKEFLNWLNIDYDINKTNWFNGTNTFLFSKKLIDYVFVSTNTLILYNILNYENSFDYCWYIRKYRINNKNINKIYEDYLLNNNIGNCFNDPSNTLRNCCVEHMFERAWINIIKHLKLNYLCLPIENIFDFYNIKINAIYFPQFHNSPENNKFWGEGFTEWTLLKPYPDEITVRGNKIKILKPHEDIGYYSLDDINVFKKQCVMAKTYGLNGFVIYHYWFGNSHSVLNKVEEHILTGQIDYNFCFSWANEPWTKRWDGLNSDVLIEQNYEDDNNYTHIEYLVKFFRMPNYIKNSQGECLFYIYNFSHMKEHFERIKLKWEKYLSQYKLSIQFVSTENALSSNKKYGTDIRFDFLPMSATNTWKSYSNSEIEINNKTMIKKQHFEIDYCNLIDKFNLTKNNEKYHFGIPLNWNNIIRRDGISHLHINNFDVDNFKNMILRIISKIILKYTNKFKSESNDKYNVINIDFDETQFDLDNNLFIINAWNEWNEQAILEPNNINGYINLENVLNIKKI
jgi:hypothetical protein